VQQPVTAVCAQVLVVLLQLSSVHLSLSLQSVGDVQQPAI
jgi:hypothetical protein